jgi:hypothetical protein
MRWVVVAIGMSLAGLASLAFTSVGEDDTARFAGTFVLEGTYHYSHNTDDPRDDGTSGTDLYFVPDPAVAATLPFWKDRSPQHEMRLRNESAFLDAVIAPATLAAFERGEHRSVSGRASVVVRDYEASVYCDYPTYSVEFVSLRQRQVAQGSPALPEQFGC